MLRATILIVALATLFAACGGSARVETPQVLVTTLSNDGAGSLRGAIASLGTSHVVIRFDPSLTGTLVLDAPIVIDRTLSIEGAEHAEVIVQPTVGTAAFELRPGADVEIRTLRFRGPGGAAKVVQARLILDSVVIEEATLGPALQNQGGILELSDCEIRDCDVPAAGAGLSLAGGITRVRRSTFANNTAVGSGGAIQQDGGVLELVNCTLDANRAIATQDPSRGGAVRSSDSAFAVAEVIVLHCTISDNEADEGGGLSLDHPVGLASVRGSIVADNAGAPADIHVTFLNALTGAYNLIGDGEGTPFVNLTEGNFVGTTASPWDPLLTSLLDLGGKTRTRQPLQSSRAFGMIPPQFCIDTDGSPLTEDQRGFRRPQGNCEAGAYER